VYKHTQDLGRLGDLYSAEQADGPGSIAAAAGIFTVDKYP